MLFDKVTEYLRVKRNVLANRHQKRKEDNQLARLLEKGSQIEGYHIFTNRVIDFIEQLKQDKESYFCFSKSNKTSTIYSNTCGLLVNYLLDRKLSSVEADLWRDYFRSKQNNLGLFNDHKLENPVMVNSDHVGWKHISLMILPVLEYLKVKPEHDFVWIYELFDKIEIEDWLESLEWEQDSALASNRIMNVGGLLQYSRDYMENSLARSYIKRIITWLLNNRLDINSGLWGVRNTINQKIIHVGVNTTYHIVPLFLYDNIDLPFIQNTVQSVLLNQNQYGGFGTSKFPNACDDIDSVYLLAKYANKFNNSINQKIENSLKKSVLWILSNQMNDGGFVFSQFKDFSYGGHKYLKSMVNEGNIFATWFRMLSLAFIYKSLNISNEFKLSKIPGYQF
jgi:hypothetical protein